MWVLIVLVDHYQLNFEPEDIRIKLFPTERDINNYFVRKLGKWFRMLKEEERLGVIEKFKNDRIVRINGVASNGTNYLFEKRLVV